MARNILVFLLVGAICINQISAESKVTKEKADTKIPVKQFPSNATFTLDSVPVVADMAIKTTASPATTHGPVVVTTTDPPRLGFIGRIRKFFSRSYDDGISLSCIEKASSDGSMINQYFVEDHKGKRIIEPTDQIYVYTKKKISLVFRSASRSGFNRLRSTFYFPESCANSDGADEEYDEIVKSPTKKANRT